MRSRKLKRLVSVTSSLLAGAGALLLAVAGSQPAVAQTSDLVSKTAFRVCADPANLPMSDRSGKGYENRIAELMASKLGLPVEYTWFPMATGFVRKTLQANACDVVIGFAQGDELVLNTNHYYTSSYVLIVASEGPLGGVTTLADPLLKDKRIGIVAGTPPATHMARNGLLPKAKGYHLMVDRRYEDPADDMLADLESGALDAAILWGPIGGPLVKASHPKLKATPLLSETTPPRLFYRITMGVRQGEKVWERKLNSLIRRNQSEINAILAEAGVPLLNDMGTGPLEAQQ
ncbi:MAG: substrate-binding domain-containing protein [Sinorhizobium meliloti]|jgi:quinoprotein dehydrogenase-associated probable ABC transporter substrate-binding protein|uniref:substrate-binding domain-containing protein n=1 Tax=Sinorhizobium TaxID=28105 RepID=UPI0003777251|nr:MULTISPECIES: substrate-binding domain-containing protein [Sinorhizobium]MCG5487552.1 substrate-binding domain-containing protein [Sinorhizobium meliloti]PND20450.1 quinoprotein dehydrogenase-associated putative ABC transporter substrate-binding protein [Ensifer sp. MMN_5]PND24780.1 quinoprotein dehydrogenase-associated putative ABC transporter substrate-binding protein [Sinorhizobium sp. M4_45]RVQ05367.1 quinoprotein dehydrogenase-associated putative ABC transporter substrate-binding protei